MYFQTGNIIYSVDYLRSFTQQLRAKHRFKRFEAQNIKTLDLTGCRGCALLCLALRRACNKYVSLIKNLSVLEMFFIVAYGKFIKIIFDHKKSASYGNTSILYLLVKEKPNALF